MLSALPVPVTAVPDGILSIEVENGKNACNAWNDTENDSFALANTLVLTLITIGPHYGFFRTLF